jgi:hypothetical protein
MPDSDLFLPGDAFRKIDLRTLAGWNAHAHENGRTAFSAEGIEVIDPDAEILAYAAYVVGEAPDRDRFGLGDTAGDAWLIVAFLVEEKGGRVAGRITEVRASAFKAQPLAEPPPDVMASLYDAAERYAQKRQQMGLPLGVSLHGVVPDTPEHDEESEQ